LVVVKSSQMWIVVNNENEIPTNKTIIVEDENGWIGQSYYNGSVFVLETFGQLSWDIVFGKIEKYLIIE
jgi:hypothetical protein